MSFKRKSSKKLLIAVLTAVLCIAVFVTCLYFTTDNPLNSDGESGEDYVKVLDVGQGDSILIRSNNMSALIDTGPSDNATDMVNALEASSVEKVDMLILTHLHLDHTGGVPLLLEEYDIENLILPSMDSSSESYDHAKLAINEISAAEGGVYSAEQGMNFEFGDFEITILASFSEMRDQNDRSLIIMAELDGIKFLFMGDAETTAEKALLKENLDLDCDVLKVGHHGSSSSTSKEFLNAAAPDYAAISVGYANEYYHPHKKVVNRLEAADIEIYRTDKNGDIKFTVENRKIKVGCEK